MQPSLDRPIRRRARVPVRAFISTSLLLAAAIAATTAQEGRFDTRADQGRRERLTRAGSVDPEGPPLGGRSPTEAPAAFDGQTNGMDPQGPDFDTIDEESVEPLASFNDNRFIFEEVETRADGLGPTYNAQSCRECHQNVVTGGASQIAEHRTGHMLAGQFFESLGGSLVHSRATHPDAAELVNVEDDVRTFRISTNTLGAGFIEAISNSTLLGLSALQPESLRGTPIMVPVLERPGTMRVGRFGWKNQHGSLESFSGDAYLNEMGITSPMFPEENTSAGRDVTAFDPVPDPEDDGVDIIAFANFMRSTKAPPRGAITPDVLVGEAVFIGVGCATCHVPALPTAPAGTVINGGAFRVPEALGNKIIHPYSDFLAHDIGTSDGIPILPTAEFAHTSNLMRTAPLWGLRTRNRLMHDGLSFTKQEAIARHRGQAEPVRVRYEALSPALQQQLLRFLDSL